MKNNLSILLCSILFLAPTLAAGQSHAELLGVWTGRSTSVVGGPSNLVFEIKKISEGAKISATIKIGDNATHKLKGKFVTNSSFVFTGNSIEGEVKLWIYIVGGNVYLSGGRYLNEYVPDFYFSLSKELTESQKKVLVRSFINDLKISPIYLFDQNKNQVIEKNESACFQFQILNKYAAAKNLQYQVRLNYGQVNHLVDKGRIEDLEVNHNCGVSFSFTNEQTTLTDSLKVYVDFVFPNDTIPRLVVAIAVSMNDFKGPREILLSNERVEASIPGEYLHETVFSLRINILPDHTYYTYSDTIITSKGIWETRIGYSSTCDFGTQILFTPKEITGRTNILTYRNQGGFLIQKSYNPAEPILPLKFNTNSRLSQDISSGNGFSVGYTNSVKWVKFRSGLVNDASMQMFGKFIADYWGDGNFCFLFTEDGKAFFGKKGGLLHKGFWLWDANCSLSNCNETFNICDKSDIPAPEIIPCRIEHSKDPNTITLINYDKSQNNSNFSKIVLKRGAGKSFFEDKEYENVRVISPLEVLLKAAIFIDDNAIVGCPVCNGTGRNANGDGCKKCGGSGNIPKKNLGN